MMAVVEIYLCLFNLTTLMWSRTLGTPSIPTCADFFPTYVDFLSVCAGSFSI